MMFIGEKVALQSRHFHGVLTSKLAQLGRAQDYRRS
jgi:hypothetical protein